MDRQVCRDCGEAFDRTHPLQRLCPICQAILAGKTKALREAGIFMSAAKSKMIVPGKLGLVHNILRRQVP